MQKSKGSSAFDEKKVKIIAIEYRLLLQNQLQYKRPEELRRALLKRSFQPTLLHELIYF